MVKLLKLLLTYKFRGSQPRKKNGGFTLIELLVGLLLALLVILPLLGLMVNMLQTDRQEQAKANSEQEIQAALDYIARDLEQAVWIYDGYGLNQIKAKLPQPDSNSTPVLVFWKRQIVPNIIPTDDGGSGTDGADDAFVYALVAYYLTKSDPTTCATNIWSCTSRISRIQLQDAVKVKDTRSRNGVTILKDAVPQDFQIFNPNTFTSVEASMNAWASDSNSGSSSGGDINANKPEVLIDYIDDTQTRVADLAPACSAMQRTTPLPDGTPAPPDSQVVPYGPANMLNGFFACVDVEKTAAQVFIRGNALARLNKKGAHPKYIASQSSYFPSGSIQVQGRGLFTIKQGE